MNKTDLDRNALLLHSSLARKGYMRWWHSFTGFSPETGAERVFFIEYFYMNPALGEDVPVLGQLPSNKKRHKKPSYFLMKAGAFRDSASQEEGIQLHHFMPACQLKTALNPLILQAGQCFYSENRIHGYVEVNSADAGNRSFMCNEGWMEWDLEIHKAISCHTGSLASPMSTALNTCETYWHAEGMQAFYRGSVNLNGTRFEVSADTCCGYADKHWGRSFNAPWVQLVTSHIFSQTAGRQLKHSALAVDGCCPRFLWFRLKKRLLLQLSYEGEDYTFSLPRFRRPVMTKWNMKNTKSRLIWQIVAKDKDMVIKLNASGLNKRLMELCYESPTGKKNVLLSDGNGEGTLLLYRRGEEGPVLVDTLLLSHMLVIYGEECK